MAEFPIIHSSVSAGNIDRRPDPTSLSASTIHRAIYCTLVTVYVLLYLVHQFEEVAMQMKYIFGFGILAGILSMDHSAAIEAAGKELAIDIVTMPNASSVAAQQNLTIQTEVHAMCVGNVFSESNPNDRAKLAPTNVDREGKAAWVWPIDPKRTRGRWTVQLQCATSTSKGRLRQTIEFP